jgi:hypothetical protein
MRMFSIHQNVLKQDELIQLWQDNQSTILAAKEGSKGNKRTKHIDIRYYDVMDLVNQGHIKINYMPTERITADYLIKSLQGELFKAICKQVMEGYKKRNEVV